VTVGLCEQVEDLFILVIEGEDMEANSRLEGENIIMSKKGNPHKSHRTCRTHVSAEML
jgi:hypothetical protein